MTRRAPIRFTSRAGCVSREGRLWKNRIAKLPMKKPAPLIQAHQWMNRKIDRGRGQTVCGRREKYEVSKGVGQLRCRQSFKRSTGNEKKLTGAKAFSRGKKRWGKFPKTETVIGSDSPFISFWGLAEDGLFQCGRFHMFTQIQCGCIALMLTCLPCRLRSLQQF